MKQKAKKTNPCPVCGRSLKSVGIRRCEVCNSISGATANYCFSCGSNFDNPSRHATGGIQESLRRLLPAQYIDKLLRADGTLKGERRIVTILFADVKGSTSLAESLDPEDVLEMMNGAFEIMIQPIIKYEGTLARLMGDAIMALFGAPIAHEDDPERACRAALDIIKGASEYTEHLQKEHSLTGFNVRVGINTGLVVVGEVGAAHRVEYTAMGDVVNVAARMETAAEAGSILITDATYKIVNRRFITESMGSITLKGKSEPVPTYRITGIRESQHEDYRFSQMKTRIIGRETQLVEFRNAFDKLSQGSGSVVSVVGDVGIGKSRIIHEAHTQFFPTGKWAECRTTAYTRGKSYEAARTLLHSIMGLKKDTDSQVAKNSLYGTIDNLDIKQGQQVFRYLSLILDNTPGQEAENDFRVIDPQVLHRKILWAFNVYIRMLAKKQSVVLFAEDLHWCDNASLSLLESMFPLTKEIPLLLIMAYRLMGEEITAFHERNTKLQEGLYNIIDVPGLTEHESNLFLDSLTGTKISKSLRQEIIAKTEGNPFFMEEVVRQIQERGETDLKVPDSLRNVIMARLDALPLREQQTLQACSVLGQSFQRRLLDSIIKDGLTPDKLTLSLSELFRRGFIIQGDEGSPLLNSIDREWYVFTHGLTQQVTYDSLLISQRRLLHRRAADAIESIYGDCLDEYTAELAEHFEIAGEKEKAVLYLIAAGDRAFAFYDHAEAINCYSRALSCIEEGNIKSENIRKIHEGLGDSHALCAEYKTALKHYQAAIDLTEECSRIAVLHRKRGTVLEKSGFYDEALISFDEALSNLKTEMDLGESARIYNGMAKVYYRRGEYTTSIDVGMLALDLMKQLGNNRGVAETYNTLGVAYCSSGDLVKGIECHSLALEIWKIEEDIYGLAATLNNLGWAYQRKGDFTIAEERYRESIALCEKNDFRHGIASASDNLSQLLVRQGKHEEANHFLRKAVTILTVIESLETEPIPELWQQSGTW